MATAMMIYQELFEFPSTKPSQANLLSYVDITVHENAVVYKSQLLLSSLKSF